MTRNRFIRIALVAPVVLAAAIGLKVTGAESAPDLILVNGKIFTSDAAHPYVQALAIRGERIVAAGDSATIQALAGPQTRQIDLGGRTVIPGINDAHFHIPPLWRAEPVLVNLGGQDLKWNDAKDAISDAVKKSPQGALIAVPIGPRIFHDTSIARETLDKISPDQPLILVSGTGHAAILNSAALRSAGIQEDQRDIVGGRYERSPDGRLTGVLREYAVMRMWRTVGLPTDDSEAARRLDALFLEAAKFGVTSMQDMSNGNEPGRVVKILTQAPPPIRVRIIRMPLTTAAGRDTKEGLSLPRHPKPLITVSGTKWVVDGVAIENTFAPRGQGVVLSEQPPSLAVIRDRIAHLPLVFDQREIQAMLQESLARNDQALFHVSGSLGAAAVLEAMKATGGSRMWATRRVRFEHGDGLGLLADLIPAAKELGVVVVQNPTHRGPIRSFLTAGLPVAIGSDGPLNPFLNIMLACLGDPESITREEAVVAYTRTSAYAEFAEKDKGSLEAGKLADLAVLSQDVFTVALSELPKTESVLTLVGGKVVYDAKSIDGPQPRRARTTVAPSHLDPVAATSRR
jgi:predicted amidohydrolase YtcJ